MSDALTDSDTTEQNWAKYIRCIDYIKEENGGQSASDALTDNREENGGQSTSGALILEKRMVDKVHQLH